MPKKHDFDAAWKSILEAFEVEIVELLFPEIFNKIDWELGTESLDKELIEIQKDIFDKDSSEKVISDKIIKVRLKDKGSKILFIHVEVQSYSSGHEIFGERMFRYFYRIWDKFRYKYEDKSEIVAAAIYTYKGNSGKDKRYVYQLPELENEILTYNFKTINVEKIELERISDDNPLKLVFKMAKKLLETNTIDEDICDAKIKLAKELSNYDKVKNNEQIKSLVDFLEYLFLIEDPKLEKIYEEYKKKNGGAFKLSIDEIRKLHYEEVGREQGREEGREEEKIKVRIEIATEMLLDGESLEKIKKYSKLSDEEITKLKNKLFPN
ncbi:Rpn family recombination-promoting nuclease/putative transposase [Clostridium estertheticum]|uniref:Rpn family recombination-promoting nuclease/putative transposase n=1 Tax=Clostridium estertheticum TaxID=238834 RepID=UPI001C0DB2E3|nr:Rpn family recombination-promoting nuclease/putative transposase [Clostridium estertheticum]MBU3178416.1 Rpn family recombination-promoting nuclease/putative transposase [Clostridium estertheticum]